MVYRFDSEDDPPLRMRLKIEINTREHFTELGLTRVPFRVESRWFSGDAGVTTFKINELMGTVQRKLQRDSQDKSILRRARDRDSEA